MNVCKKLRIKFGKNKTTIDVVEIDEDGFATRLKRLVEQERKKGRL